MSGSCLHVYEDRGCRCITVLRAKWSRLSDLVLSGCVCYLKPLIGGPGKPPRPGIASGTDLTTHTKLFLNNPVYFVGGTYLPLDKNKDLWYTVITFKKGKSYPVAI